MKRLHLPLHVSNRISERAVEYARRTAPKRTGRGAASLTAVLNEQNQAGVRIPTGFEYMEFQEKGTRPRIMHELAGKTIPIRTPGGQIVFRRATVENIGRHKITSRDELGRIITSKISWRYPGMKPKNFIKNALQRATKEELGTLTKTELIEILKADPDYGRLLDIYEKEGL